TSSTGRAPSGAVRVTVTGSSLSTSVHTPVARVTAPPTTTTSGRSDTTGVMSVSQAPTPSRTVNRAPSTATMSWAATRPSGRGWVGVGAEGTGVTAVGATASWATGVASSSTVNSQAGTCASPRLVRTGTAPRVTPVTVSGRQAVSVVLVAQPSGPGSTVGPPGVGRPGRFGRPGQGSGSPRSSCRYASAALTSGRVNRPSGNRISAPTRVGGMATWARYQPARKAVSVSGVKRGSPVSTVGPCRGT